MECLSKIGRIVSLIMDAVYSTDNDNDLSLAVTKILKELGYE